MAKIHANRVFVEFTEGKEIPAEVIASVVAADVALIKLEWVPADAVIARLGDSDQAEEGSKAGANLESAPIIVGQRTWVVRRWEKSLVRGDCRTRGHSVWLCEQL